MLNIGPNVRLWLLGAALLGSLVSCAPQLTMVTPSGRNADADEAECRYQAHFAVPYTPYVPQPNPYAQQQQAGGSFAGSFAMGFNEGMKPYAHEQSIRNAREDFVYSCLQYLGYRWVEKS